MTGFSSKVCNGKMTIPSFASREAALEHVMLKTDRIPTAAGDSWSHSRFVNHSMKITSAFSVCFSALIAFSAAAATPPVVINEFMAANTRAFPDITDFEDYPDWIELKNTTAAAVSLNGYFLSDDPL